MKSTFMKKRGRKGTRKHTGELVARAHTQATRHSSAKSPNAPMTQSTTDDTEPRADTGDPPATVAAPARSFCPVGSKFQNRSCLFADVTKYDPSAEKSTPVTASANLTVDSKTFSCQSHICRVLSKELPTVTKCRPDGENAACAMP